MFVLYIWNIEKGIISLPKIGGGGVETLALKLNEINELHDNYFIFLH